MVTWSKGASYSVCEDFVDEDTELVPAWRIIQSQKRGNSTSVCQHFVDCCEALGIHAAVPSLDRMLVLDYIIVNEDRHLNNFGALRNAETLERLSFTTAAHPWAVYRGRCGRKYCGGLYAEDESVKVIAQDFIFDDLSVVL